MCAPPGRTPKPRGSVCHVSARRKNVRVKIYCIRRSTYGSTSGPSQSVENTMAVLSSACAARRLQAPRSSSPGGCGRARAASRKPAGDLDLQATPSRPCLLDLLTPSRRSRTGDELPEVAPDPALVSSPGRPLRPRLPRRCRSSKLHRCVLCFVLLLPVPLRHEQGRRSSLPC